MLGPRKPLGGQYVGAGGALVTPEQVAQQKQIAAALLQQAGDTSPVGHLSAALNRGLQGWLGGRDMYRARQAESEGTSNALERFNSRNSGAGAASRVAEALAGGVAAGQPSGKPYTPPAEAAAIREGLITRGLPEHIADGFIMNFQDESGLNPGINERNPVVPGSRGGFGLYQLTGPRRVAYEQFAADRGVDPADVDAQLDFLMYELQGPESKAAQSIFSAQNAGEAGAAIVNQFLRPAAEHRTSRSNRYLGAGAGISQAPAASNVSEIATLLADPWLPKDAKAVLQAEMNQQMQMQNADYEFRLQQQDPMRQIQLQQEQLKLEQMLNPGEPKPIEVGGVLLDAETFQPLFDSRTSKESEREAEIARGMSIGLSREDAIKLADGMTRLATNPITGEHQIIDMATNQIVPISPPQQQGVAPGAPQEVAPPTQPILPDARLSFGLGGAARGLANSAADTFGLGIPYPEEQAAQSDFAVMRESILNDIASAYDRQPPSWLLEEIRRLTPEAGSITQGASGARSKLESLRRNFTNELAAAEGALQNNLSPDRRQKAVEKVDGIRNALARIDRGLGMLDGGNQSQSTPATSTGVKWRIID